MVFRRSRSFGIFLLAILVLLCAAVALLLARLDLTTGIILGLGTAVSLLVFLNTELAVYLLIFSMLLSPELAISGWETSSASLGRGVTFRLDDLLLALVSLSWLMKGAIYKELGIIRKTPLNTAMLLYVAACSIATLSGVAAGRVQFLTGTLFVLKYTQYFLLFFMIVNSTRDARQLRRYWVAMLLTALIAATIGILQIPAGERVTAPFEGQHPEPNSFGGYLLFLILLVSGLALCSPSLRLKLLYSGIALYLFIPFLFTLSRASYIGFLPGFLLVLLLSRNRMAALLLTCLALFLFLVPDVLPRAVQERIAFTWSQSERDQQRVVLGTRLDTSTSARLGAFENAFDAFLQKPVLGWGVTGWRFIDSQYFRTLVETGIFGFTALLFLLFGVLKLGWSRLRTFPRHSEYYGLTAGYLGGVVGLLVHAFGSNTFIIVRIMEPFWLVTGLLFVAGSLAVHRQQESVTLRRAA